MTHEMSELAAQITLIEHELFRSIKPNELLGQVWIKNTKEVDAPNILRLIDHFNNVCATQAPAHCYSTAPNPFSY